MGILFNFHKRKHIFILQGRYLIPTLLLYNNIPTTQIIFFSETSVMLVTTLGVCGSCLKRCMFITRSVIISTVFYSLTVAPPLEASRCTWGGWCRRPIFNYNFNHALAHRLPRVSIVLKSISASTHNE